MGFQLDSKFWFFSQLLGAISLKTMLTKTNSTNKNHTKEYEQSKN